MAPAVLHAGRGPREAAVIPSHLDIPFVIDHMGYLLDIERLLALLAQGNCWIKSSGPYRLTKDKPLSNVESLGRVLVAARPDRLLWGTAS